MLEVKDGDLLAAPEQWLAHQCNCITRHAAHLARDVFNKFPYANIYSNRATGTNILGNVVVSGGQGRRLVLALLGQLRPGRSQGSGDDYETRYKFFCNCLNQLGLLPQLDGVIVTPRVRQTWDKQGIILDVALDGEMMLVRRPLEIAMPQRIGCGAAGGDWGKYKAAIEEFANDSDRMVVLYGLKK
jgi:hypothetical protein